MHDLIIKNAVIVDGTGAATFEGSVAVDGDRIVAVGAVSDGAREEVDAGGLVLSPGIIDSHTHYDAQLTWDQTLSPSPEHGVTTVIIGNCGFTIAPCKDEDRDLTLRNLTQVEGMSLNALRAGVDWSFNSFPEYLDALESRGSMPNVAAFVGHSAVRTWVMGADAVRRAASSEEVDEMAAIVAEAMGAGAVGFATSTAAQHNGDGGIPMPSRLADDAEMRALARAMAVGGKGVFMLTRGGETSIDFLESLSAETERPVMIAAQLYNSANPRATDDVYEAIEAANGRGHPLYGQVSCCPLSMEFDMKSPYVFEGFAAWKPAMLATNDDERMAVYRTPAFRQAVRDELAVPAQVRLFNGQWDRLQVLKVAKAEHSALEGRPIADIAGEAGQDPLDCLLDLALAEDLETEFLSLLLNYDEEPVGKLLTHPQSSIALSDAGAHLTFFCDVGFGLHLFGHWSREKRILSLEAAVHAVTGQPAAIYGIADRGRIAAGCKADMLLFDPDTVGRSGNRRVFDLPDGAARLVSDAHGVHGVWINGARVVDGDGNLRTDQRPGELLRDFAA